MKEDIVDLLRHPCKVIVNTIKRADCQFGMKYDDRNARCRSCKLGSECRWLGSFDNVRATDGLSPDALLESLHAGRDVVLTRVAQSHNVSACACKDCRWLRESRRLLLQSGVKPRRWAPA